MVKNLPIFRAYQLDNKEMVSWKCRLPMRPVPRRGESNERLHAWEECCAYDVGKEFFRRTLRMKNSVAASNISRGQLVSVHWRKIRLSGVSEMNLMISTSKP